MTPEQYKGLVRRYVEIVWNQSDPAQTDELIAQDDIQHAKGIPPGRA